MIFAEADTKSHSLLDCEQVANRESNCWNLSCRNFFLSWGAFVLRRALECTFKHPLAPGLNKLLEHWNCLAEFTRCTCMHLKVTFIVRIGIYFFFALMHPLLKYTPYIIWTFSVGISPHGSRHYLAPEQSVEGYGSCMHDHTSCPRGAALDLSLRNEQASQCFHHPGSADTLQTRGRTPSSKPGPTAPACSLTMAS